MAPSLWSLAGVPREAVSERTDINRFSTHKLNIAIFGRVNGTPTNESFFNFSMPSLEYTWVVKAA
jgi:hypothetical protein